jgi:hypothetical protein
MPRRRRLLSPAVAFGISLLTLFITIVLAGTVSAVRNTVAGTAYPAPRTPTEEPASPAPEAPAAEAPAEAPPPAAPEPQNPGTPTEAAPPAQTQAPAPPARNQPAGTVRLVRGGTVTLVRREIGIDGVLPIPSAINQASWWGAGLRAQSGATVVAGHINWKGAVGPFAELWNSHLGDPVSVVDQSGERFTYHVSQIVTLGKDDLPSRAEELFAQSGPHRLVLVTCGGQWVGGEIGYASNQIVIATQR